MADPEQYLARWRDAGLIDAALVQRILAYEDASPGLTAAEADGQPGAVVAASADKQSGTTAAESDQRPGVVAAGARAGERSGVVLAGAGADERPGIVEALLYLGVAIALVGVFVLTADHWGALNTTTRLATVGIPGGLALLAGLFMRRSSEAQLRRAAGIAWLTGVVLLSGTVVVAGVEFGWAEHSTTLVAATGAAVLALLLWWVNPSRPQLIALAGSSIFLAESVADQWSPYRPELAGLLILLSGAAGILLTERKVLRPHGFAAALSGLLVVTGALHTQWGLAGFWAGLPLLAAGAVLIGLSLQRGAFTYLLAGVLATFLGLVLFIFQHFESTIGVPAALLLTGCLLVGGVLFVSTWRRRLRSARIA